MKQNVMILKADDSPAEMLELESNADGQPSFKDVYPLINTTIIEIAQGRWIQQGNTPEFVDVELFCDEEALCKAEPQINHRASHLRYNLFKSQYGAQMPDPRLAGDVAVVFPAKYKIELTPDGTDVTGNYKEGHGPVDATDAMLDQVNVVE
jgi:hypothetical protein